MKALDPRDGDVVAVTIRPYGDAALLVDVPDTVAALGLRDALLAAAPPGLLDLVPAASSLLVRVRAGTDLAAVAASVRTAAREGPIAGGPVSRAPTIEIPVVYDGPDLAEVATSLGLSAHEVVAAHCGRVWTVAFAGFAPGFGYLRCEDSALRVSRRSVPRTVVPAGSVALAGEFAGVYPRASPGGWQLVGRTDVAVWDLERDPPALLAPGRRVRFVERAA